MRIDSIPKKISQRVGLGDSHLIFDGMQLLAFHQSLSCDCPMADDYVLEINLPKCQKDLRMALFTFNGPI